MAEPRRTEQDRHQFMAAVCPAGTCVVLPTHDGGEARGEVVGYWTDVLLLVAWDDGQGSYESHWYLCGLGALR